MSFLNKKPNAWVTGHSGFIGTQLAKDLSKDFEIFKISRNDIVESNNFFKKKILLSEIKKKYLIKSKKNYLFHLATLYNPNPKSPEEATNIIESNLLFGLRLLHSLGYDFFNKILLTQSYLELQKSKLIDLYTQTKSIFANELEKTIPDKIIKIYLYDTFGLSDKREKLINIWLKKLILNKSVTIYSEKTKINLSSNKFISNIITNINSIKPGKYEIRSNVEMTLTELFYFLKDITKSKSRMIIKKNKPVKIFQKHENLSEIINIKYTLDDFRIDIKKILKKDIRF